MSVIVSSIVICGAMLANTTGGGLENEDHLVPLDMGNPKFRHVLTSKLAVTPFNCGRVTILPSFEGESSISVYCPTAEAKTCRVTYIAAEDNLYQRTDGGQHPEHATAVKTKRMNAELTRNTAEVLREIWLRMLKSARPHVLSRRSWRTVPVDSTSLEFSLERPGGQPVYGEIDIFLPDSGKNTKKLLQLSHALVDYCKAAVADRPAIAAKIDRDANRLLAQLKRQR